MLYPKHINKPNGSNLSCFFYSLLIAGLFMVSWCSTKWWAERTLTKNWYTNIIIWNEIDPKDSKCKKRYKHGKVYIFTAIKDGKTVKWEVFEGEGLAITDEICPSDESITPPNE